MEYNEKLIVLQGFGKRVMMNGTNQWRKIIGYLSLLKVNII